MNVRRARREDCAAILEIYNDAVVKTTATYDYEPRTLEHRQEWFDEHERCGFPMWVAEENGAVIGWSALGSYHDRAGYRFTLQNAVYVAESARGRGVGKALMQPLVDWVRAMQFRAVIAVIDADNAASIALHAKFGFVEVGRFPKVGFKFGRWLDVAYMELLLPEPSAELLKWPPPKSAGS